MRAYRLLDAASPDVARELLALARPRRFAPGETIFHDGDPGDSLHLIASGHVAIRITTPLGDVATVRILRPGEHFGELAVLEPGSRTGSARALDKVQTMVLHRNVLIQARERLPELDQVLTRQLVAEVRRLAAALVEALYLPVEKRLWRRLCELADIYSVDDGPVTVPLTQEELAQLAGTTRPTANKLLRPAADAGVIRMERGRITLCDMAAARRRAR